MKYVSYLIMASIFISCHSSKNINKEILNCLDTKLNKNSKGYSDNFYQYLRNIESYSINNKFLKSNNKDAYLDFYNSLYHDKQKAKAYVENVQNSIDNEYYFNFGIIFSKNKDCHIGIVQPDEHYDKNTIDIINKKIQVFDKLESDRFDDYDSFIFLIKYTNFKNEKDRLLLLNTILIYVSLVDI